MKRFLNYSKKNVPKSYSAMEIARLIVYKARQNKFILNVRQLERLLFMAQSYHYINNNCFLFTDTMYIRNQQLYTPAVRREYNTLHYPVLFDINSYSPEVIKTIDDVIDIVKRSSAPSFVCNFIPTNEKY